MLIPALAYVSAMLAFVLYLYYKLSLSHKELQKKCNRFSQQLSKHEEVRMITETVTDGENTYTVEFSPRGVKVFRDTMEITPSDIKIYRDSGAEPVAQIGLSDAANAIIRAYVYTAADMDTYASAGLRSETDRRK